MTPENLGSGSGMNHEGDIVPIEDVSAELGHTPMSNSAMIEAARRLFDEEDVIASNIRIDHDGHRRIYPQTVEEVVRARGNKPPVKGRSDAYSELGGGLQSHRDDESAIALENVLTDAYRPWQTDIRAAVEQFGLVQFTPAEFHTMKPDDYKVFCEQFYEYLQGITRHKELIEEVGGRREVNPVLADLFGEQSSEELLKYAKVLEWLKSDLEALGIPRAVLYELKAPENSRDNAQKRATLMREAAQRRKRHHGKVVQVVKIKDRLALEWHEK